MFKDVTLPDMKEKESKKSLKSQSAEGGEKKPAKTILTLTTKTEIRSMFEYENDYEILDQVNWQRPPKYKFVTPAREVVQRLIIRASMEREQF